jgi:Transposase DDE domain/Insertion element 4 transposase N-terminal
MDLARHGRVEKVGEIMSSKTPFFKAFGPLLFGRAGPRRLEKLGRMSSLQELYELFGHLLPERLLARSEAGVNSRERLFSPQVTFWAFAAQILSPGTACREIVRRVEAWWQEGSGNGAAPSASTSAYCQARARLDPATLELIRAELAWSLERNVLNQERWLGGRAVKIVDGTGISMPDTSENQALWPQPGAQQAGCGFPVMKLVGLFSLGSGALLEAETGNLHMHDSLLFRALWNKLQKGDIVLADRGFCSYAAIAKLQQQRGVDSVMRLHQMRKADFRTGRRLGPDDRLIVWQKPLQRTEAWSEVEFAALPGTLSLRMIRVKVTVPGFRSKGVVLVTTLLDPIAYPAAMIRELYGERWQVELHFQQIKTYLGMDVLRCKSPDLIQREVLMHQIAYNLVRSLMQRSAHLHHVALGRLSFKGTLDTLRHWSGVIAAAGQSPRQQQKLIDQMLALIAGDIVRERPGRSEPRAKKRRGKNYKLLMKPRHQTGNLPRRNRPQFTQPKTSLT